MNSIFILESKNEVVAILSHIDKNMNFRSFKEICNQIDEDSDSYEMLDHLFANGFELVHIRGKMQVNKNKIAF